ncbi:MAG: hypothetical protein MK193_01975 [Lentisphaeria bacterium]|nr:hypothetical protein [Lentisphaeria bacterium]
MKVFKKCALILGMCFMMTGCSETIQLVAETLEAYNDLQGEHYQSSNQCYYQSQPVIYQTTVQQNYQYNQGYYQNTNYTNRYRREFRR